MLANFCLFSLASLTSAFSQHAAHFFILSFSVMVSLDQGMHDMSIGNSAGPSPHLSPQMFNH